MTLALLAHSWLRWLVVATALVALALAIRGWRSARPFTRLHARLVEAVAGLAKLQLLVGLALLLWLSPIARAAWQGGIGAMFGEPALVFFGLAHPGLMTIGVGVLEVGRVRSARSARPHRTAALAIGAWLGIAALAIPWPGLPWGRPLVRVELPVTDAAAPATYTSRCASCHGPRGAGDGPLAPTLTPRPRAFDDLAWQRAVTDAYLHDVIRQGGAAHGRSALMPQHDDLSRDTIDALVVYIRSLAKDSP